MQSEHIVVSDMLYLNYTCMTLIYVPNATFGVQHSMEQYQCYFCFVNIIIVCLACHFVDKILAHFAVPTAVTALDTERTSNMSLQVTWDLPEVLNGILVYYAVNVSSISVGYFETWRIQADDPLQLNISGLGKHLIVFRSPSSSS